MNHFFLTDQRWWEINLERQRTLDALYRNGEWAAFVFTWKVHDFERGWVQRCPNCQQTSSLVNSTYQSPAFDRCVQCLGTLYSGPHGGVKALLVRPSMWTFGEKDVQYLPRGETETVSANVTTTHDVRLYSRDYVIRADGNRFGVMGVNTTHLSSGFGPVEHTNTAINSSYSIVRENETSPAYMVDFDCGVLNTSYGRTLPDFPFQFADAPIEL